MSENASLVIVDNIKLQEISATMQKISQFQSVVQKTLKDGHDYGIIPGTEKPTLLKPGAEKILMLMGLTSEYQVEDKVQDYDNGFFAFTVKCTILRNGIKITEGVGHANTKESHYTNRWVTEKKIPEWIDKSTLQIRKKESKFKKGEYYTEYLIENSDGYTLANTVLKMAKKRAQVDAVLTVASLSDIFTQDLEDLPELGHITNTIQKTNKSSKTADSRKTIKYNCSDCGIDIPQAVKTFSEKNFGRPLCRDCQKKPKEEPKQESNINEHEEEPKQESNINEHEDAIDITKIFPEGQIL